MSLRGSGLSLPLSTTNLLNICHVIRQLIEGRSNNVVTFTITNDGSATSTTVTAPTCGPNSIVTMPCPVTAAASTFLRGNNLHIKLADITKGQFVVTHATTTTASLDFMCAVIG